MPHPSTVAATDAPPALVIVGGGPAPATPSHDATIEALLFAKLPAAQSVLACGVADATRAAAWRARHPEARWIDVDPTAPLPALDAPPDLIVVGAGLARWADPLPRLRALAALAGPHTRLVVGARNAAQAELLERVIEADLTPAEADAWSAGTRRADTASSLFKLLLDAGWMPRVAERGVVPVRAGLREAAHALADVMNVPHAVADRRLGLDTMVIEGRPLFAPPPVAAATARFDVVVPTTRESQLRANVEASPGLREVGARTVSYRRARTPAEALEGSLAHTSAEWILFCHQDIYFPAGFGARLNALLDGIPADQRSRTLIGFAGLGMDVQTSVCAPSGFVIDRTERFDHPASETAVSLDELAIVVSRDSIHRIDPALGWHLWATDLCLTAIVKHGVFARIVRLPLFHNSSGDYVVPESFHASAQVLGAKHAGFGTIHTLCGDIAAP